MASDKLNKCSQATLYMAKIHTAHSGPLQSWQMAPPGSAFIQQQNVSSNHLQKEKIF